MSNWKDMELGKAMQFNPSERIAKGKLAKKIPMGKLTAYEKKISGFEVESYSAGPKFRNGDTLVAKITPCLENGKTANVDILDENEVAFGSSEFIVLRQNEHTLNDFIFYLARSPAFRKRAIGCMEGTSGRKRVNEGALKIQVLPIPDLSTQQKIASVLSALDAKIELNNRINAELEAMAKTLYDYWFVQFDFPDEQGRPYKTSGGRMVWNEEIKREVPMGWEVGTASQLFDINPTLSIKKGSICSYIDMNALPTEGYMTKEIQKKEFNGGVKFQNGDLVISRITPCLENGKTGLITLLNENEIGFGSTEFIVLRGRKLKLISFAAYLSRSELFRKHAITNMIGTSGRKRVDASQIGLYFMPLPPIELLKKFEKVTGCFFEVTTLNTKQNQHLTTLRDWLLPMLMNGQVGVD
jgi:type I restriction enzyme, S subunit